PSKPVGMSERMSQTILLPTPVLTFLPKSPERVSLSAEYFSPLIVKVTTTSASRSPTFPARSYVANPLSPLWPTLRLVTSAARRLAGRASSSESVKTICFMSLFLDEDEIAAVMAGVADDLVLGRLLGPSGNRFADFVGQQLAGSEYRPIRVLQRIQENLGEYRVPVPAGVGNGLIAARSNQDPGWSFLKFFQIIFPGIPAEKVRFDIPRNCSRIA